MTYSKQLLGDEKCIGVIPATVETLVVKATFHWPPVLLLKEKKYPEGKSVMQFPVLPTSTLPIINNMLK